MSLTILIWQRSKIITYSMPLHKRLQMVCVKYQSLGLIKQATIFLLTAGWRGIKNKSRYASVHTPTALKVVTYLLTVQLCAMLYVSFQPEVWSWPSRIDASAPTRVPHRTLLPPNLSHGQSPAMPFPRPTADFSHFPPVDLIQSATFNSRVIAELKKNGDKSKSGNDAKSNF